MPADAVRQAAVTARSGTVTARHPGTLWCSVAAFAVAVGAVEEPGKTRKRRYRAKPDEEDDEPAQVEPAPAEDDAEKREKAKHKALNRRAATWAKDVFPKHVALAAQQGKGVEADLRGEQHKVPGGASVPHVGLPALLAMYAA